LEPGTAYDAVNYHGMRDYGRHRFRHALFAGPADVPASTLARQAEEFNAAFPTAQGNALPSLPSWQVTGRDVMLVTVKRAERGQGVIMRLVVMGAEPDTITVTPPAGVFERGFRTNLLEEPEEELAFRDGRVVVPAGPWKLVTLLFEGAGRSA
jgi:alpha-mannosidase